MCMGTPRNWLELRLWVWQVGEELRCPVSNKLPAAAVAAVQGPTWRRKI